VNRHRPDTGFTPLVEVATSSRSVELELLLQQAAPRERVQALEHSLVGLAQALLSGPMETDLRLKVGGTFDFGPFDFRRSPVNHGDFNHPIPPPPPPSPCPWCRARTQQHCVALPQSHTTQTWVRCCVASGRLDFCVWGLFCLCRVQVMGKTPERWAQRCGHPALASFLAKQVCWRCVVWYGMSACVRAPCGTCCTLCAISLSRCGQYNMFRCVERMLVLQYVDVVACMSCDCSCTA
jgi:hypothetical protein